MRPQVIIVATLLLNAALFAVNLFVALLSGSRAVLSQAVYSVADMVASGLLLWGFYASHRTPTLEHPFGFGKERFFWAFIASFVTFTVAGLLVLITGLERALAPQPVLYVADGTLSVGLALAGSIGGILIALAELRRSGESVRSLLESAHLGVKTVFLQDVVSVGASAVAFGGIALVAFGGWEVADGISASIVGALLLAAGLALSVQMREFLIGRSCPGALARHIFTFGERDPRIRAVRTMQSMMLGPDDVLLTLRVNFIDGLTTDHIEREIDMLAAGLRAEFPQLKHIIVEPES